jgi:DNA-binding MarR family transcriptional regulator
MTENPKPLAGRRTLTVADIWRLLLPSFWWTPQGTPLLFLRQSAVVALIAFAGLGVKAQTRLLDKEIRDEKRRMIARKYHYEWWMPMTEVAAHVVGRYRAERPETASGALFVTDEGRPLSIPIISKPFTRADELLGNEVPLTTMLAKFFADNVESSDEINAMLAFVSGRLPGQPEPPAASMKEMVSMLNETDLMGSDLRPFDNEAYAVEKIKALGGTDLPPCLWDLTKHRNVGRKFKGTLPDDHPIVQRLKSLQLEKGNAGAAAREPIFQELIPEIDELILDGEMSAAQAADLFGMKEKGFSSKRQWWRKGGSEARKAANAAKPKESQAYPRPPLTREQETALKALGGAVWPRLGTKSAAFRQGLVDQYFSVVAKMIADRNLKGYEAAKLFRVKATVISDLLADIEAGSPLVVHTTDDPEERQRARKAVEAAIADREDDETFAQIARRVRRETNLRISSEFVRAVNEMTIKKIRAAADGTKRRRRPRNLRTHGLTPKAVKALWCLDRHDGRSIGSLAREWGHDDSIASTVVEQLVKAGFADRRRDPLNWRRKLVCLTDAGTALKQELLLGRPATDGSRRPRAANSPKDQLTS